VYGVKTHIRHIFDSLFVRCFSAGFAYDPVDSLRSICPTAFVKYLLDFGFLRFRLFFSVFPASEVDIAAAT
jgi:hypothetical protein